VVDDDVRRVAAVGDRPRVPVGAVVGAGEAGLAILLEARAAARAGAARIHDAADGGEAAGLEAAHLAPDRGHAAHDLVAGHARIDGALPLGAHRVQVRVADTAEEDVDGDVARAGLAARERPGGERLLRGARGVAFGVHVTIVGVQRLRRG
jgi:hypothetical protein